MPASPWISAAPTRRAFHCAAWGGWLLLASQQAQALTLGDLSAAEAGSGLKGALEASALAAVGLLGQPDGFLGNPRVRIPLPGFWDEAAKVMRRLGQGPRLDALVTTLNRAAESAVPMGQDVLLAAVRSMTVEDAKGLLSGGGNAVTRFFAEKTRVPLGQKFLPVVTQATEQVALASQYNALAGQAARFGLVQKDEARIEQYVTGKTLDGLYFTMGEQEQKIRQNPAAAGSALAQKVFGALR
ncbi:MAG: DUF4197 domain-containing protein [Burkholderiaceae bacterium]|nr:DUF4197 domain-containing protein [Burkholderiaceae bacterium]